MSQTSDLVVTKSNTEVEKFTVPTSKTYTKLAISTIWWTTETTHMNVTICVAFPSALTLARAALVVLVSCLISTNTYFTFKKNSKNAIFKDFKFINSVSICSFLFKQFSLKLNIFCVNYFKKNHLRDHIKNLQRLLNCDFRYLFSKSIKYSGKFEFWQFFYFWKMDFTLIYTSLNMRIFS
jgi:hypothetical protein